MFRLVKVKGGSIVAVYKKRRDGGINFFGATAVEKDKRVPVLWGYTYSVFDAAPIALDIVCDVTVGETEKRATILSEVAVTVWSAENAVVYLIDAPYDTTVAEAKERIAKAARAALTSLCGSGATLSKPELSVAIAQAANVELNTIGLTVTRLELISLE